MIKGINHLFQLKFPLHRDPDMTNIRNLQIRETIAATSPVDLTQHSASLPFGNLELG